MDVAEQLNTRVSADVVATRAYAYARLPPRLTRDGLNISANGVSNAA